MPIFLEPGQRYPIVLESDKGKIPTPTFYAKSQSMRGQLAISEVLDQLTSDDSVTTEKLFDATKEKLGEVIFDWSNMIDPETKKEIPFSKNLFLDVLTYSEARELLRKIAYNMHYASPEEKKS